MALASLLDTLLCSDELLDHDIDDGELPLPAPELREKLSSLLSKDAAPMPKAAPFLAAGGEYLDRCFLTSALALRADRPWMARLAAVACLALAAKVEEASNVPPLLNIQLPLAGDDGDSAFVFEPKTVRRMELLVLQSLDWRMYSVTTALSYVYLLLSNAAGGGIRRHCECILLDAVADWRWVQYPASAWAAAAMVTAADDAGEELPAAATELLNHVSKDDMEACKAVIFYGAGGSTKRKRFNPFGAAAAAGALYGAPASPNAVVGACFSCDSSSDSWMMMASVSSSPVAPPPASKKPHLSLAGDGADLAGAAGDNSWDAWH